MEKINWSELFQKRSNAKKQFGELWQLPIAPRYHSILDQELSNHQSLLEIGAGDRGLKEKLQKMGYQLNYKSCDIDRTHKHDYYDLDAIEEKFDVICLFEIIEHITPEQAYEMLGKCIQFMNPGGKILITTPNIYYPPAYLRDATHITPWCYDELAGMTALVGFKIKSIFRLYKDSVFKAFLRRVVFYPLFRVLGIDFARQVIVVAEKP